MPILNPMHYTSTYYVAMDIESEGMWYEEMTVSAEVTNKTILFVLLQPMSLFVSFADCCWLACHD